MGLILNRPSKTSLLELIKQLVMDLNDEVAVSLSSQSASPAAVLLDGGPVAKEQAFVVHSPERSYQQSLGVSEQMVLSTDRQVLQDIAQGDGPRDFVIAQGYAGWGPGQLEAEMADDAWVALSFQGPLTMQSLFKLPPKLRLEHTARCAGLDLNLVAGRIGYA